MRDVATRVVLLALLGMAPLCACREAPRKPAGQVPTVTGAGALSSGTSPETAATSTSGQSVTGATGADPGQGPSASEGSAQPSSTRAELIPVSGDALIERVRQSKMKAVIVNAWASWCGPCRREMPMLVALKENLEPRGIGVEWVSVDEPASQGAAVAFLKQYGAALPSYVAERPLGPFKAALHPNWPGMLPASFLFDATGKLRYFWGGPAYEDELLAVVERFLAGTLVDGEARFGLAPGKRED